MKSKIAWTILSGVLGGKRASRAVEFFDTLIHCFDYYKEAMEYRVQFFSQLCIYCLQPRPVDANFCPACGRKVLSEEERMAEVEAEWAREQEQIRIEESAAWAERREEQRRDTEMVYH